MKKWMTLFFALSLALMLASCLGPKECKHSYGSWTVTRQVSCTGAGVQSRNCMKCGYLDTQTIEPLGHTEVVDAAKAATCSEYGLTEGLHCSVCNMTITAQQQIPMIAHIEVTDAAKAATCTDDGLTEGSHCSVCNAVLTAQTKIPALGHSYLKKTLTEATCQTEGLEEFNCPRCNDHYTNPVSLKTYSASEIYDAYKNSVGEIVTYDQYGKASAIGTGFVYSSDGKIITNYHVIEGAYSAEITIGDHVYLITSVLAYDSTIDIAVLKINASGLQELPICYEVHKVGQPVYAFGSSKGLTDTLSSGMITYSQRLIDGIAYVQHDASISGGNSGGPLINQYGEIIGINTWTVKDSQNLNFAIAMKELQKLRYGTPMTLEELFSVTNADLLTLLKAYVMSEGDYDRSYDEYSLLIGYDAADDGTEYYRIAYYYPDDDIFELSLWIDSEYYAVVRIDEIGGTYLWYYNDIDDDYMEGEFNPAAFHEDVILSYTYHEISNAETRTAVAQLASLMIDLMVSCLDYDLSDLGVTAADLGFIHY